VDVNDGVLRESERARWRYHLQQHQDHFLIPVLREPQLAFYSVGLLGVLAPKNDDDTRALEIFTNQARKYVTSWDQAA